MAIFVTVTWLLTWKCWCARFFLCQETLLRAGVQDQAPSGGCSIFKKMYILTGIISDMFGYTSRCSMQLRTIWTRKQWNTRPHVRQKTLNHGLQNNCIDARKGWNYTKLWNVCHVMPRVPRDATCAASESAQALTSECPGAKCVPWLVPGAKSSARAQQELSKSSARAQLVLRSLMLFFFGR